MSWLFVFIGGGVGSVSRYAISILMMKYFQNTLPLATLISNVVACAVLAVVVSADWAQDSENKLLKLGLAVGFCGGFSTFSTFSFETLQLIKNGNHLVAAGNIIVSVVFCLILIYKLTK